MSISPSGQALIKLTGVSYPQVRLEQAAMTMMMIPGDLYLAPHQELVHGAGGDGVKVPSQDHGAVLTRPVWKQENRKLPKKTDKSSCSITLFHNQKLHP